MIKSFVFFSDSGHGWLRVNKSLLNTLNISNDISGYSYMRKDFAYLEEDMDASTFLNAYKEKYNIEPKITVQYSDRSRVRTYEHYEV